MSDSLEPDTIPDTPEALHRLATIPAPPPASGWARWRGLIVDGAIVLGLAVAVWKGAMAADVAGPIVAAVLLSHAKPQGTSAETAAAALLGVMPKLFGRRNP